MKADHLCNFNSIALPQFEKYNKNKQTNTLLNHFLFILEFWMYHTQLTWHKQEYLGHKANFEAFPRIL
jgi:hypothetical protein